MRHVYGCPRKDKSMRMCVSDTKTERDFGSSLVTVESVKSVADGLLKRKNKNAPTPLLTKHAPLNRM